MALTSASYGLSAYQRYVEVISFTIPSDNEDKFQQYVDYLDNMLEENPTCITPGQLSDIMGNLLAYKEITMISLLNNLIRKHKLITTKAQILKSVYYARPTREKRES